MSAARPRRKVLIVDDAPDIRETLADLLAYEGFETEKASRGSEALAALERSPADLVLLDIKMPGQDGIEVLGAIGERFPGVGVVMISGHGDIPTAVEAMRRGAFDFLEKPLDSERVLLAVRRALRTLDLERENRRLREEIDREVRLLGDSPAMAALVHSIERVARTDERVLLSGENGTGKELVARRIHLLSERASGPFVPVNCAAIPETLIEAELFGHEKGAFTGASARRPGVFEQANGGTLFLDEIGEMPLPLQAKLLRVLEEEEVRPLGASAPRPLDVRVVAATNRELRAAVEAGEFRQDLFFRLAVVPLRVPSLRERREDVPVLARDFLLRACRRNRLPTRRFTPEAEAYLAHQDWPGNVRQLENFVSAAVVLVEGEEISAADLADLRASTPAAAAGPYGDVFARATLREYRDAADAAYLTRKLAENEGNVKRTAETIGIARAHLYRMLERLGLR